VRVRVDVIGVSREAARQWGAGGGSHMAWTRHMARHGGWYHTRWVDSVYP